MFDEQEQLFSEATSALRALDEELKQKRPSAALDERVLSTFQQRNARESASFSLFGGSGLIVALGVVVLCLFVGGGWWFQTRNHMLPGGFVLLKGRVEPVRLKAFSTLAVRCLTTTCQLSHPQKRFRVVLRKHAQVISHLGRFHVPFGRLTFRVKSRRDDEPNLRIRVSHGYVEVVGTTFTIHQRKSDGVLTLHHGKIRFHHITGLVQRVVSDGVVSWPFALSAPPPRFRLSKQVLRPAHRRLKQAVPDARRVPKKARVRPRVRVRKRGFRKVWKRSVVMTRPVPGKRVIVGKEKLLPPQLLLSDWIRKLNILRTQGRFRLAVRWLQRGVGRLRQPRHERRYRAARERFHYELGLLFTYQLHDPKRACHHWKAHLAMFHRSRRYKREVKETMTFLKCKK